MILKVASGYADLKASGSLALLSLLNLISIIENCHHDD